MTTENTLREQIALLTRGLNPRLLTEAQIRDVVTTFNVEWDA